MPEISEVIKREIANTENSIKYFDTHIDFLNDLKINKPELEIMFEGKSYDEAISETKKSRENFSQKLYILKEKLSEIENKALKKAII